MARSSNFVYYDGARVYYQIADYIAEHPEAIDDYRAVHGADPEANEVEDWLDCPTRRHTS